MDIHEFVTGCRECDPHSDPERAYELLQAAAELGEAILNKREKSKRTIPYQQIADHYNEICGNVLPRVTKLTDKRKRAIKACIAQGFTVDDLCSAFQKAASTPFLTGKNERNWRAGFDFIMKPDNLPKILEGVYGSAAAPAQEHSYNLDLILEQAMNTTPTLRKE